MPDAPMPPQGADPSAEESQEPQDPASVLAEAGDSLQKAVMLITQDKSVPDEAKKAFAAALDAFSQGAQLLQGGGAPDAGGPVSPEQGASGAQPMSMQKPG